MSPPPNIYALLVTAGKSVARTPMMSPPPNIPTISGLCSRSFACRPRHPPAPNKPQTGDQIATPEGV
eukprot:944393-Prorocentrum_minimum.AAC.1